MHTNTVIQLVRLKYCRWGFECEILLITNCELLYKTQSQESQEKNMHCIILHLTTPLYVYIVSIANIDSVAFSFGNSESQSGLYSTIHNRLTMHSKPYLQYPSIIKNHVSSIENHVKLCRKLCKISCLWLGLCTKRQFICQAFGHCC